MRGWVRDGLGSFSSNWSCIILLARSHLSGSALWSLLSASCRLPRFAAATGRSNMT